MERDEYPTNLQEFIENVLEPSESLARLLRDAFIDMALLTHSASGLKTSFNDMAQISGALTSLTRYRLQEFAERLQEHVGEVQVMQPEKNITIDYEVCGVQIQHEPGQRKAPAKEPKQ